MVRHEPSTTGMTPPASFTIAVPQAKLDAIRQRVTAYPWDRLDDLGGWQLGTNLPFMRRAAAYWLEAYDWRAAERELNRFPGFKATVNGVELHFLHERGSGANPRPVILIHGWPSTVYDFAAVIEPLAHPERFGGNAEDGVTVVVPSIPGYGWSGKPPRPQGRRQDATVLHSLMVNTLGYPRYVAAGGDFGGYISGWLGLDHPEAVDAIYLTSLNLRPTGAPYGATHWPDDYTADEQAWLAKEAAQQQQMFAYAAIQGTQPQTLAYPLMDSPVGQAAWILEKYRAWTSLPADTDPDAVFGMDRLLTQVMIYLVTDSFATSLWAYPGLFTDPPTLEAGQRITVPAGYADFPDPLVPTPPRSIAERVYHFVHWTAMPRGGHFAAFEEPELFRTDLQQFLRRLSLTEKA